MTKTFLEALLFASIAINAALLLFFAGVYRKMMDAADAVTFKNLTGLLVKYSSKSPFMIVSLNLPLLIAIPYYYYCGFGNWYITSSLILWLVSGSVAKAIKLPVYKNIAALNVDDADALNNVRKKLNFGNQLQAMLYVAAIVVMGVGLLI